MKSTKRKAKAQANRRNELDRKKSTTKPTRKAVDVEVVQEYAELVKKTRDRQIINVHVVNALTMQFKQHGGSFPVALNSGTRPRICSILKRKLGEDLYKELCPSASDVDSPPLPVIPQLPQMKDDSESANECISLSKDILLQRFPQHADLLLEQGAQCIPLINQTEVKALTAALSRECSHSNSHTLSVTQGSGRNGAYCAIDLRNQPLLRSISEATKKWIESNVTPSKPLGSKAILLRYGEHGVNYAHHDNSGDFQALLMLSKPKVDYNGGTFYLAESDPPHAVFEFPFEAAGELIIFRGDRGKFLHGMNEVSAGTTLAGTRRFAVGLFQ